MPGGRPTTDPKTTLIAVRLAPRHVQMLERRARREQISVSEALRRYLDEVAARATRAKPKKSRAASPRGRRS